MKRIIRIIVLAMIGVVLTGTASATIDTRDVVWTHYPTSEEFMFATPSPVAPEWDRVEVQIMCTIVDGDGRVRCVEMWEQPLKGGMYAMAMVRLFTKVCRVDMTRSKGVFVGGKFFVHINFES